jgi:hypothetical protein
MYGVEQRSFGLLVKKAYASSEPSLVRSRPGRVRTFLLRVPVVPRTTPRPARL